MDNKVYLNSLILQKAELTAAIKGDNSFTISVQKHEWLTMLGCVEIQINIINRRILTFNKLEFDHEN